MTVVDSRILFTCLATILCSSVVSLTTTQPLTCDENRKICYSFHSTPLDHGSASAHCSKWYANARLLTIPDNYTRQWFEDTLARLDWTREFWLGVKLERLDNWMWIDGSPFTAMERLRSLSNLREVTGYASIASRRFKGGLSFNFEMTITPFNGSTQNALALCEKPAAGGGKDYFELSPRPAIKDWYEARSVCNSSFPGADLAVLSDGDISRLQHNMTDLLNYYYFIGLSNVRLYITGSRRETLYTNFFWTEPKGIDTNGCVYSSPAYNEEHKKWLWYWFTSNCTIEKPFICEYDQMEDNATSRTTNVADDARTTSITPRTTRSATTMTTKETTTTIVAMPATTTTSTLSTVVTESTYIGTSSSSSSSPMSSPLRQPSGLRANAILYILMAAIASLVTIAIIFVCVLRYYSKNYGKHTLPQFPDNPKSVADVCSLKAVIDQRAEHDVDQSADLTALKEQNDNKQTPHADCEPSETAAYVVNVDAADTVTVYASIVSSDASQQRAEADGNVMEMADRQPVVHATLDFN